jgi:hypothetical protein
MEMKYKFDMYLVSKELSLSPSLLQHLANCSIKVSTL